MADRDVIVHILGDSKSYERALKRSETGTAKFAKKLDSLSAGSKLGGFGGLSAFVKGGGIALGAGIAANEIRNLANAGSDLNEEISKSQQVFGHSSVEIQQWSKTTAEAIGVSRTEALQATGTFGNLFNTVGLGEARAAAMSKRLVELAADLASFNNADPSDTLDAIRSGLIGEAEPLRRYGVLLSEARVQQQAMADTGKKSATSLTDQEKAVARYELILKDTVPAQGDFARTSGGLANQQRILRARLADTRAELGTHLLPIMVRATEAANKFFDALDGNQVDVTLFNSEDFRNKFVDAFGADKFKDALNKIRPELEKAQKDFAKTLQPIPLTLKPVVDTKNPPAFGQPGFKNGKPNEVFRPGPTAEQRNRWFDSDISRQLDKNQDIPTLRAQIDDLRRIEGLIQKRIDATKDITRKLNLEDQLRGVSRQERGLNDQIAANAAEAKRTARLREQQAQATRLAQRTARQFRELGLDAEGNPVTASAANLQTRIASIADRIAGTKFDTPKLENQLARFRRVLSEGLVPKDVRGRIQAMLDDINATLNEGTKNGPLTKTTQLSADRILGGLGLGADAERTIRARLSHFNSAGKALSGTGAGSTIVVQPPPVYLDGALISKNSAKHNARARNVNASRRNGPNAGLIVR